MVSSGQSVVAQPLPGDRLESLRALVADYDREQLIWSSGFLAGLAGTSAGAVPAPSAMPAAGAGDQVWTILYAGETGNSRGIAEELDARARAAGIASKLQDIATIRPRALAKLRRALFVVATHGIGEAPEGTAPFFELWFGDDAPRLETLEFSVLALGDSSYVDFCEIGRRLDERLAALGATRIADRLDCDLDFAETAERWTTDVLEKADRTSKPAGVSRTHLRAVQPPAAATRSTPFSSRLLTNQRITGSNSSKDVRHVELDLASSGISYLPGDSLGVVAKNPPQLVERVLEITGLDGHADVRLSGDSMTLAEALLEHREITALSRPLLEKAASEHPAIGELLADRNSLQAFLQSHQLIDLLSDHPMPWGAQDFVDALRKMPPRLYSIASSPDANPDEAHLTVAVVNYEKFGRPHWGAASTFLAERAETAPVYVEANHQFRLPRDADTPVIMIGAGTGIAPYRAFVEHRREHGHSGANWLIFGDRTFSNDFLYQLEWLRFRKEGYLKRIDVAFSRDGRNKVYVQHRIADQSARLYDWLERGAHIYVCGDATCMAVDVHRSLLSVLQNEGGMSEERAAESLKALAAAGRYQRDVY